MSKLIVALLAVSLLSGCTDSSSTPPKEETPTTPVIKYVGTFDYPPNSLAVGDGTVQVAPTSVTSCKDEDGNDVNHSKCGPLSSAPTITYLSPAGVIKHPVLGADTIDGTVDISLAEGESINSLTPADLETRVSAVLVCASDRYKDGAKCLITCPSGAVADESALNASECQAQVGHYFDGNAFVPVEPGYFQSVIGGTRQICPASSYQDQSGQAACEPCTNRPAQATAVTYSATEGKTSATCDVATVSACAAGYHPNLNFCYQVTEYEAPANSAVCSGTVASTQVVKTCEYGDGSTVSGANLTAHCPAPSDAPAANIVSAAGTIEEIINNGVKHITCAEGQSQAEAEEIENFYLDCSNNARSVGGKCRLRTIGLTTGSDHACVISAGNKAFCWGKNDVGQLGNGTTTDSAEPVAVSTDGVLSGLIFKGISAGKDSTCAIAGASGSNVSDKVYCWGSNAHGKLGNNSGVTHSVVPVLANLTGGIVPRLLSVGGDHVCATAGGPANFSADQPYCWGKNSSYQLGTNNNTPRSVPTIMDMSTLVGVSVTSIAAGAEHTCAVIDNSGLFCTGVGLNGENGNDSPSHKLSYINHGDVSDKTIFSVYAGNGYSCAVDDYRMAYCWGMNDRAQLGVGSTFSWDYSPRSVLVNGALAGQDFRSVALGNNHACASMAAGHPSNARLACWGNNTSAEAATGIESLLAILNPTPPDPSFGDVPVILSAGNGYTCYTDLLDTVKCFGSGANGRLGNGNLTAHIAPLATPILGGDMD